VIIHNLLHSITLLTDTCHAFRQYCVEGLTANQDKIAEYLNHSLMLVTALNPIIGYDKSAQIAHQAFHENTTLKAACVDLGFLSAEAFDQAIQPKAMTTP
jgi:fumarate hydratase class II